MISIADSPAMKLLLDLITQLVKVTESFLVASHYVVIHASALLVFLVSSHLHHLQ